jgi:hypothetical protein
MAHPKGPSISTCSMPANMSGSLVTVEDVPEDQCLAYPLSTVLWCLTDRAIAFFHPLAFPEVEEPAILSGATAHG